MKSFKGVVVRITLISRMIYELRVNLQMSTLKV